MSFIFNISTEPPLRLRATYRPSSLDLHRGHDLIDGPVVVTRVNLKGIRRDRKSVV